MESMAQENAEIKTTAEGTTNVEPETQENVETMTSAEKNIEIEPMAQVNAESITAEETTSTKSLKEKLWSMNFLLLWQGKLVSTVGDVMYEIALGFWVLAVTGSTALMGTLMAASLLPSIIISPIAGVFVDRKDRRKMMIAMDLIRGITVVFIGIAGIFGFIQVWMVFAAGIILGLCGAFFGPSVSSAIPDIVPKSKVMQANSVMSMANTGTSIVANPLGGLLFNVLGAPIMFLTNGLSFLFSAGATVFVKVPKIEREVQQTHFIQDLKEGLRFVWNFRGLRYFILIAAGLNFFANTAMVLFMPLFQRTASLGAAKYGVAVACMTGGMFAGMAFTTIVNIPYKSRFLAFMCSGVLMSLCFSILPFTSFGLMVVLLVGAGFFNAVVNVFLQSAGQLTVPPEMRGKVFGLMETVLQGLTPIGMALGGILGEFISIPVIISVCFIIALLGILPLVFITSFRRFINFNPDTQKLEEIL